MWNSVEQKNSMRWAYWQKKNAERQRMC